MEETSNKFPKLALAIGVLVVVAILGAVLLMMPKGPQTPDQIIREAENVPIPPNARAIDAFVFVDDQNVYIKSIHGTSTTRIPQADPSSFAAVGEINNYGPQEVLDFCKGAGLYSLYKDRSKVYFFQAWKTESFAKTKIEVVKGLDPDTLTATEGTYTDANHPSLTIGHAFATTTCSLSLQGV